MDILEVRHFCHLVFHPAHQDVRCSLLLIKLPAQFFVQSGEESTSTLSTPHLFKLLKVLQLQCSDPGMKSFGFVGILFYYFPRSIVVKDELILRIAKVAQ